LAQAASCLLVLCPRAMDSFVRVRRLPSSAMRVLWCRLGQRSSQTLIRSSVLPAAPSWPWSFTGSLRQSFSGHVDARKAQQRALAQEPAAGADKAAFLGIVGNKDEQIALKNSNIDQAGIWSSLPEHIRESLRDPSRGAFLSWLGHGVTEGKAAIIRLVTEQEAAAIVGCMGADGARPGVMDAARVAELYVGRVNTSRHLIFDEKLAECFFQRIQHCRVAEDAAGSRESSLLASMKFGAEVVAVNGKIRLVTTKDEGEHQKHADVSERSDDGSRVSRLTFQCYLNPKRYEGGHFQLYPEGSEVPVDIPMAAGSAVVFVQEDPELMHGGGRLLGGGPKRAIRGNLDAPLGPEPA